MGELGISGRISRFFVSSQLTPLIALVAYGAVQTTGTNVNAIFGSISNQLAAAGAVEEEVARSRSAQEMATTRCRCSGRKSLPVAARRRCSANSVTSPSLNS